jgi:hypothetical protein
VIEYLFEQFGISCSLVRLLCQLIAINNLGEIFLFQRNKVLASSFALSSLNQQEDHNGRQSEDKTTTTSNDSSN